MKRYNSQTIKILFITLFTLLVCGGEALAQDGKLKRVNMRCDIVIVNKHVKPRKHSREQVRWTYFNTIEEAMRVKAEIEKNPEAAKKYKVNSKADGGVFNFPGYAGMGIVVISAYDDGVIAFEAKDVETYKDSIEVRRIAGGTGYGKKKLVVRNGGTDTGDGNERFEIFIPIDTSYIRPNSRIILQTTAVDCTTEDTMAFCSPVVYEGDEYHMLQNRRKAFELTNSLDSICNVEKRTGEYDQLYPYYTPMSNLRYDSSGVYIIDTVIVYKKPNTKKTYKGPFELRIEDYHKVYHSVSGQGTCLRKRPFKFLDFSVAIPEMELTDEFQVDPEKNIGEEKKNILFRFVKGRAELTNDSINDIGREELNTTIRRYGSKLFAVTITGTSSPEGGDKINMDLANKRATVAMNMVRSYVNNVEIERKVKLYKWDDVVLELEKKGYMSEATELRDCISKTPNNNSKLYQDIQRLSFYEEKIVPIMEQQRMMQFDFLYTREKILEPDEAVAEFHRYKKQYLSGEKKFSNGDFYNLFATIENQEDLDSITVMAYKQLTKYDNIYFNKIAPYVFNRMERLNQRMGVPDTTTLSIFLSDTMNVEDRKAITEDMTILMNRRDLLVTQAMSFYMLQEFKRSEGYIKDLTDAGKNVPGLDKLSHYMNIRTFHNRTDLNAEQQAKYEAAKSFLLDTSSVNKAILYAEIQEWSTFDVANKWVDLLDDNNPKKWYLKGLLYARQYAGESPETFEYTVEVENSNDTTFYLLTEEQEMDLRLEQGMDKYTEYLKRKAHYVALYGDSIPRKPVEQEETTDTVSIGNIKPHLAYFNHCFEMAPSYRRYYFSEGLVDEEMRKKYPYKKKQIPAYRKAFKMLKKQDDANREKLIAEGFGTNNDNDDFGSVGGQPISPITPVTPLNADQSPVAAPNENDKKTNE